MIRKSLFYMSSILVLVIFSTSFAFSQTFSTNTDQIIQPSDTVEPELTCGDTMITHSMSQVIIQQNSVACNNSNLTAENSYYRAFDLDSFGLTGGLDVCEIQIGIENAVAGGGLGGMQPATINLYTSDSAFPAGFPGSLTQIGTTGVIQIADQSLTILTIPVTGSAPAGSELVVEVFIPNGQTQGNSFFIGSNPNGETGASYLRAPTCGAAIPTSTTDLGFPAMHIVMNVYGNSGGENVVINSFNNSRKLPIKNKHNKISFSGVSPNEKAKLFWGFRAGTTTISGGNCDGTQLNIKAAKPLATFRANGGGTVNKKFFLPSTSENKAIFQVLDQSSCAASESFMSILLTR